MPYTIKLEHVPAGYSTQCAEEGEEIDVVYREFTSTEDGQLFISRLEDIPSKILEKFFSVAKARCVQLKEQPSRKRGLRGFMGRVFGGRPRKTCSGRR